MKYFLKVVGAAFVIPALLAVLFSSHIILTTKHYIYSDLEEIPSAEAALILGAAILRNGNLSPVLKDRTDQAIALYENGKVKKIIASGDNSTLSYNEVQPIQKYLLAHDIPEADILLDYAGFDTYSSIYRSRDVFLTHSLIVVSQSFHLPRAVYIARRLGLDAYGMNADNGHYKLTNYFREMLADTKAIFNLVLQRKPQYLGEEIPISDDRRKTAGQLVY